MEITKVRVTGSAITAIGKELDGYNAIDTGIFRINMSLAEELRGAVARRGDASLSDGVRALAARGLFVATDVGDARWIDVDTPEAHVIAERLIARDEQDFIAFELAFERAFGQRPQFGFSQIAEEGGAFESGNFVSWHGSA